MPRKAKYWILSQPPGICLVMSGLKPSEADSVLWSSGPRKSSESYAVSSHQVWEHLSHEQIGTFFFPVCFKIHSLNNQRVWAQSLPNS